MSNHSGKKRKGKNTQNTLRLRQKQRELIRSNAFEEQPVKAAPAAPEPKKRLTTQWFYDNRVIAVFSLLLSIGLWCIITLNVSSGSSKVIKDVPIRIETADLEETFGLQMISIVDPPALGSGKVDVTVSGSIYHLSRVTADDITVTAQVNGVNRSGESTLGLVASCSVRNVNVKIENNYDFVRVWFDHIKEKSISIEKVVANGVSAASDDLIIGDSVSPIKTLRLSGPESVIDSVASIQIRADVNQALSEPLEAPGTIVYLTRDGSQLSREKTAYISIVDYNDAEAATGTAAGAPAPEDITVIVPISKTAHLPLALTFRNVPANFDPESIPYKLTPAAIDVEGDIDTIDKLIEEGVYTVEGVDLASLSASQFNGSPLRLKLKLNLSSGLEELGGVTEVEAALDFSKYATKTLHLVNNGSFTVVCPDEDVSASVTTESLDVVIAGPEKVLSSIGAGSCSVTVTLDADDITAGQRKLPARVTVKNKSNCLTVGSYTVMVLVSVDEAE